MLLSKVDATRMTVIVILDLDNNVMSQTITNNSDNTQRITHIRFYKMLKLYKSYKIPKRKIKLKARETMLILGAIN